MKARDGSGLTYFSRQAGPYLYYGEMPPSVSFDDMWNETASGWHRLIIHDRSGAYLSLSYSGFYAGYHPAHTIRLPSGDIIRYIWQRIDSQIGGFILTKVEYPDSTSRRYGYDGNKRLTEVRDETGQLVAKFEYDASGRVVLSRRGDANGPHRQITIAYNADGSRTVTDADGVSSVHTFATVAGSLRLTGASQPCDGCSLYQSIQYDPSNGLPIQLVDHAGIVTEITRNPNDPRQRETKRIVGVGTPEARTVETTWHPTFNLPTEIRISEAGGGSFTRTMAYDGKGRVTLSKLTQTLSTVEGSPVSVERTTTTTYVDHPNGQAEVVTVNGPREDVDDTTIYRYDSAGRLLSVTNPQGQVTSYSDYDVNGRARTITHPNGVVTQLVYDWKGRLLSRTTDGIAQHFTYYPNGLLKTRSTPGHSTQITTYAYDAAHRVTRVTDPMGNRTETDYDTKGRVKEVRTYDAAGTLRTQTRTDTTNAGRKSVTYTPGSYNDRTTVELDPMYRLDKLTDPMGRSVDYTRDAHGRPVRADHSSGLIQTAVFDAADGILASNAFTGTPQRDRGSAYAGDADGGMHQSYRADTGLDDYELDGAGNMVAARNRPGHLGEGAPANADGPASTTEYDTLNRPTRLSVKAPDGSETAHVEYAYDLHTDGALPAPTGRLTRVAGSYGSTDLNYDAHGNLVRLRDVREGIDATQMYAYDTAGRLIRQTYPSGREIEYTLDARGLPTIIRTRTHGAAPDVNVATAIQYTPAGALANWTRSNGRASPATYDLAGRLKTYDDGARMVVVTYHPDGRVWDLGGGGSYLAHYEYDDSGRLSLGTGIFGTSGAYIEYDYDKAGDMTSMKRGDRVDFAYHPRSSMLDSAGNGALVHTYGPRGVITADGINFTTLNYDERGFMAAAVTATGTYVYAYDAAGRRVAKTLPGGQRIHYHYDAQNRLIAESQNGVWLREYLWLGERPVMMIVPGATEQRYDIHVDYANTPVRLTDSAGTTVWQWARSPFGSEPAQGPVTFNLRMPGQYRDAETGYHYNMARYYDPRTGRYLQPDPAGEAGGLSAYTYADGDPVNRVDPTGWVGETVLSTVTVTASPDFGDSGFGFGNVGISYGGGAYIGSSRIRVTGPFPDANWENVVKSYTKSGCSSPPAAPPGVNVNDNIAIARDYSWLNP